MHTPAFDAELYAASCALQYAANLPTHSKVVSLGIDNQATINTISRHATPTKSPSPATFTELRPPYSTQTLQFN